MIENIKETVSNFAITLTDTQIGIISFILAIISTFLVVFLCKKIFKKKNKNSKEGNVYQGLTKSREGILSRINEIFSGKNKDREKIFDEIEELLVSVDVGSETASYLCYQIKDELKEAKKDELKDDLKEEIIERLQSNIKEILKDNRKISFNTDTKIIMVVGVNGVGKTTTIAKLASKYKNQGMKVLLVAGDTFRAAATEQLNYWAEKIGVDIVLGKPECKPSTVVFDAMKKIKDEKFDVVLIDTAGRLHNKSNLMQELTGIQNAISKNIGRNADEAILVIDGTSGQNAICQAKEFNTALDGGITGVIITKLDGTSKGGILIAVRKELGAPVYYIGVGEKSDDLIEFNEEEFTRSLFSKEN